MFHKNPEVLKKVRKPKNFRGCVSQCSITKTRNNELFLSTPPDKVFTMKDCITRNGVTIVRETSSTNIKIGKNACRWRRYPIVECALNITKNTLECLKWSTIGYYMYWLTKFTAWTRSGWVIVKYCNVATMEQYNVGSEKESPSLVSR